MTAKWLRRRFGLHARSVAVRTSMPWYLRALSITFVAVAVACLLWIGYWHGRALAGWGDLPSKDDANKMASELIELDRANSSLKSELAVLERQLQIERATYADLTKQIKTLTLDNARLREEAELLRTISAADAKIEGIKVSSARVEPSSVPGEFNYRIVLLQTGSRSKPFRGRYQLVVDSLHNGAGHAMTLPGLSENGEPTYQLDFRVHQRIEGMFRIDPGAVVRSVELRVFEGRQSQPKLRHTVKLS